MAIVFTFKNRNKGGEIGRVYRSTAPIDPELDLPPVYDTLPEGATTWTDEDVHRGEAYHYLFATEREGHVVYSASLLAEALPTYTGPGPDLLLAGDLNAGFFGEVPASELITSTALASLIGLSAGTAQHQNEPWLKFIHRNRILYVAKKTYRHSISWDQIHARGAVFGTGPSLIEIGEDTFKCRLLTGGDADPASVAGGEWDDLFYPIHVDDPQERGWAHYTDADLLTHSTHGNGTYSWCQETVASSAANRVGRGYSGVTNFDTSTSSNANTYRGWRPCLELILD